jgi:hypothetical protein
MHMKARRDLAIELGLVVIGLVAAGQARAALSYNYFYVAGQNSYNSVTPGSAIQVPLFLEEVNSDGSSSSLLASEHGVSAAGISISLTFGTNPTTITGIVGNGGAVPGGFDEPITAQSTSSTASILENVDITDSAGVGANSLGNGVSEVLLGTLSLQASSFGGQTTVFTVGPFDLSGGNTFTNDSGYDLDNNADVGNPSGSSSLYNSAASTTFSIATATAVPEPASLSLLAVGSVVLLGRHRRH